MTNTVLNNTGAGESVKSNHLLGGVLSGGVTGYVPSRPANELPMPLMLRAEVIGRPVDYVLPGFKRATVGAVVGESGIGKSFWVLALAFSMSATRRELGLLHVPVSAGRVVMLSGPDGAQVLGARLGALLAHVNPQTNEFAHLDQMKIMDCSALPVDLMDEVWITRLVNESKDASLIIIDGLHRFHGLDETNARDMRRLSCQLERIALLSGAAVLYTVSTFSDTSSGVLEGEWAHQALLDSARWLACLRQMSASQAAERDLATGKESFVELQVKKQCLSPESLGRVWYRRQGNGMLLPVVTREKVVGSAGAQDKVTSKPSHGEAPKQRKEGNDEKFRNIAPPLPQTKATQEREDFTLNANQWRRGLLGDK